MDHAPQGISQPNSQQGNQQNHIPQGFSQYGSHQGYQQHAPQGVSQEQYQHNHAPQGISQYETLQGNQQIHAPQGIRQNRTLQEYQQIHAPQGISQDEYQQNNAPQGISKKFTHYSSRQHENSEQTFQIFVKYFADGKNYTFDVTNTTTVDDLKVMIQKRFSDQLTSDFQRLTYGGKNLDKGTMQDNNIQAHKIIFLAARVLGG